MNDAFGHPQSLVLLGGTSEIGLAITRRFVGSRCRTVVLAARSVPAMRAAAESLHACGKVDVKIVEIDTADLSSVGPTVDRCFEAAGGHVDMVVATLGALGPDEPERTDPARIADMIAVNFTWPAAALGRAADRLHERGAGRIVVLSSVAAVRPRRANFLYGAAKAGLDAYALGLGERLRGSGVRVTVVRPGFVHTKMTSGLKPAPFAVHPDAVASATVRGVERSESIIWTPSFLRWAFIVLRHLPDVVWRRIST